MIMRKHCGNCANHRKETNAFSEECGKCVSARLENGETTDPSHWREKPLTNADRIRAMSEHELAVFLSEKYAAESIYRVREQGHEPTATQIKALHEGLYMTWLRWLRQPVEVE
jgi:hypothetical protein